MDPHIGRHAEAECFKGLRQFLGPLQVHFGRDWPPESPEDGVSVHKAHLSPAQSGEAFPHSFPRGGLREKIPGQEGRRSRRVRAASLCNVPAVGLQFVGAPACYGGDLLQGALEDKGIGKAGDPKTEPVSQ